MKKRFRTPIIIIFLFILHFLNAQDLKLAEIFNEGAVLQCNSKLCRKQRLQTNTKIKKKIIVEQPIKDKVFS